MHKQKDPHTCNETQWEPWPNCTVTRGMMRLTRRKTAGIPDRLNRLTCGNITETMYCHVSKDGGCFYVLLFIFYIVFIETCILGKFNGFVQKKITKKNYKK